MSSRAKKKRLKREENEKSYKILHGFYDNVINTLEKIQADFKSGKLKIEDFKNKGE